ncbi:MAG: hypothetical protein ISQ26_10575 [Candidatus Puniceispirillum sp.]|nr:hypothetical protein [Candidatus Puniceispirillum sp.]
MKVVLTYRTPDGVTSDWVCDEERLNHIMKVCEEKGFEVIAVEYLL